MKYIYLMMSLDLIQRIYFFALDTHSVAGKHRLKRVGTRASDHL